MTCFMRQGSAAGCIARRRRGHSEDAQGAGADVEEGRPQRLRGHDASHAQDHVQGDLQAEEEAGGRLCRGLCPGHQGMTCRSL